MARGLEIIALAGVALGAAHILQYAQRKRQRHEQREALQTWEDEGGAVPTSRTRTAAMQVTPAATAAAPA
jgi:hypothetical protein